MEAVWIDRPTELESACRKIQAGVQEDAWLAVDTEFIRESTYFPQLEIIQLGTETEVYLIDFPKIRKEGGDAAFEPLRKLFRNPNLLKVLHAAQGDQECFFFSVGVLLEPVFDTSLAAALSGFGDQIGLGALMSQVLDIQLPKGHARTQWNMRPLPAELLRYAAADVRDLVRLGKSIREKLKVNDRWEWALQVSAKYADPDLYEVNADNLAARLMGSGKVDRRDYGLLKSLVTWRESYARNSNLPKKWVAEDGLLVDIVRAKPDTVEALLRFRGVGKSENKIKSLWKAIEEGKLNTDKWTPKGKRPARKPSQEEERTLQLLKLFLQIRSDDVGIPLRLLVDLPVLEVELLRGSEDGIPATEMKTAFSDEGQKLVYDDFCHFFEGKAKIGILDGKMKIFD